MEFTIKFILEDDVVNTAMQTIYPTTPPHILIADHFAADRVIDTRLMPSDASKQFQITGLCAQLMSCIQDMEEANERAALQAQLLENAKARTGKIITIGAR